MGVLDHINKGYEKKMKKLEDEEKKNEAGFTKEKKGIEKKYNDEMKANHKAAAKEEKKRKAAAKAKAAMDKEDKDKEEAEKKRHGKANAKIEADLKKEEAKNTKDDKKAAKMQKEADAADAKEKKFAADMKKADAARDAAAQAQADEDAEMKSCAMDGSECELDADDGTATCEKVIGHGGKKYYVGEDLVTCTTKKPSGAAVGSDDGGYTGEGWAKIPTDAPTPAPAPSKACVKAAAKFAKGPAAKYAEHGPAGIACAKGLSADEQKAGLEAFMHVGSLCPAHCDEENNVHVKQRDGGDVVSKICITPEDVAMFKEQIEDMPVYKAMGTNGRFKAGPKADVCRMVKNIQAGWNAGKAITSMTF